VIDAGRSYLDQFQLYVNPCNLFLYREEKINEPCAVELFLPPTWQVAGGMPLRASTLLAADYHVLADSPFFAGPALKHLTYVAGGITFHAWFQGLVAHHMDVMREDLQKFSEAQIRLFGGFPASEYHFLFYFLEDKMHHGVEHQNSTVIVMGPGRKFMLKEYYDDFLGISSHELFHAWNVKAIRPADMQPYDYGKAQYSKLHYVTEGVTTYYGDLMLLKAGVWDLATWLVSFNTGELARYYNSDSRSYISLEQSSFESWTVGYSPGVPNRKISFYSKGAIVAFLLDIQIRSASGNQKSLDDVMREMYLRFGKTGKGYTREDYLGVLRDVGGMDFSTFFELYISGTHPVEEELAKCAAYIGLKLIADPVVSPSEERLGLLFDDDLSGFPIKTVFENSPAEKAGLAVGDIINTINGVRSVQRTDDLVRYFVRGDLTSSQDLELTFFRFGKEYHTTVTLDPQYGFSGWRLAVNPDASPLALSNQKVWSRLSL
jgi:predicted metalloprotease with PDZ domain